MGISKIFDTFTVEKIREHENIKQLTNVIAPTGVAHGETRRKALLEEVSAGQRIDITPQRISLLWNQYLCNYNLRTCHTLWGDLGMGLYSILVDPQRRNEFAFLEKKEDEYGYPYIEAVITKEGYIKAAMGPVVDDNGRILHNIEQNTGLYDAVGDIKEQLYGFLAFRAEREPICLCSINKDPRTKENTLCFGKPIEIIKWYYVSGKQTKVPDAIAFRLDPYFFPISWDAKKQIAKPRTQYFPTIAGLSSVLAIGRQELKLNCDISKLPRIGQIHRAILFMQLAISFEEKYKQFNKGYVLYNPHLNRYDVLCNEKRLANELLPSCVFFDKQQQTHKIKSSNLIDFLDISGNCLLAGMKRLDVFDKISSKALFPAIERAGQYDKKGKFFMKAEPASKLKEYTYSIPEKKRFNETLNDGKKDDFANGQTTMMFVPQLPQ